MAYSAAFELERSVFINERSLLVGMALDTCGISPDRKLGLLSLKASVGVMTIAAAHGALKHLVMERLTEL